MCTDFVLRNHGDLVMSGRSLDWESPLEAFLFSVPTHQKFESMAPHPDRALHWQNKYRFVGIEFRIAALIEAVLGHFDAAKHGTWQARQMALVDGLNDQGLSAALLWMPGSVFPAASADKPNLAVLDLVTWIVSRFATVSEVIAGLSEVQVWSGFAGQEASSHFAVHDRAGDTLIIEFLNGQMNLATNQSEVLTNYPPLAWQLANLDTYVNLTNVNVKHQVVGQEINGSGMLGLPADATPPSRFVRTAYLKKFVPRQEKTAIQAGVEQALHLLNNIDIVRGDVRPAGSRESQEAGKGDYTQWSVVRDHTNTTFYFRTEKNLNLRRIVVTDLTGTKVAHISLSASDSAWFTDVTASLQ